MKDLDRDAVAHDWTMTLMRRAFRDLAVSFAALDPRAADTAIMRIEQMVVAEMQKLVDKPPKGVTVAQIKAATVEVIMPFREMTQEARALIQQAGKPRQ